MTALPALLPDDPEAPFPPVEQALRQPDGLLAVGGDLSPARLLHFLALAYHHHADAVVSKDRAVLDLAKRARKFGVTVLSPLQLATRLSEAKV